MTSTINVNLKLCDCPHGADLERAGFVPGDKRHYVKCAAAPTIIPCPIPRSVSFEVVLGACDCPMGWGPPPGGFTHRASCPSHPVRVTCSIGGEAWEESEVTDVDNPNDDQGRWGAGTGDAWRAAVTACGERWALVKALMLRVHGIIGLDSSTRWHDLEIQRDAVFAALADMARAEEEAADAQRRQFLLPAGRWHDLPVDERPSKFALERYIEHLISQVVAL